MNEVLSFWFGQETGYSMSVISIRWGLTLLHFLWQGAIIGLLAFAAAKLLRSHSATIRYWLNAAALLACPICVAWTFAVVEVPKSWRVSPDQHSHGSLDSVAVPIETSDADDLVDVPYPKLDPPQAVSSADAGSVPLATLENPAITPVVIDTTTSTTSEWMPIVARWIASLYAVGVVCFLVRLAIALWGGHRLRAISTPVSDSALLELIRTQAQRIGLKLVPVVAYCERVAVPTVIGVLRPMILLPATLTTGLTTDELSAILSHELAHIRRYDLWMNLLQRIIESLLFFHPVVWLLSRRLSAEREICCDDLVIRSGRQPMNYAGALLRMAELCAGISPQNSLSLAATSGGTSLLEHRVLRLIHETPSARLSLDRKGLLVLVSGLIATLVFALSPSKPQQAATVGVAKTANAVINPDPVPATHAAATNPDESEEPRTELISITGSVLDVNQTPLAGVRVFVVSSQYGVYKNLADTVSKEDGSYEFSNVELPIVLDEMFGRSESVGAFEVFAISDAHGFTWRASRAFLPDSKPSRSTMIDGDIEAQIETEFPAPDSPSEFFSGDDIEMDLVFDKPTKMRLRVVDDEGQPIQNARVRLWNAAPIPGFVRERFLRRSMEFRTLYDSRLMPEELVSRTTDKDGWFEYSAMPLNCEFRIEVNPEGFAKRMIHATTGENYKSQYTVLYRNDDDVVFPRTAEVTVSVQFADTQQPAPRVWVSGDALHGSGSQYGSTNESGEIVLSLPPGECALQVLPEYKTAYVFVDDDSLRCIVEKGKKNRFEISLQRAVEVEVRVIDAESEQPVAGADLWVLHGDRPERRTHKWRSFEQPNIVRQAVTKSDEDGIIQTYFAPGKYSIGLCDYFTPPGYAPTAIADAVPVEFKAGEKQVVTLKLKRIEPQAAVPEKNQATSPALADPENDLSEAYAEARQLYPNGIISKDQRSFRSLRETIEQFNLTSKESPTGVSQPPITEQETREAMAKFAAEKHVPEGVRTQLEQILKSGELPSNVYFRRFTRFDDGKQMQNVWWVRLVVETRNGPVYSVPVRTTSLSARPYTQMERQQNAADGITLIGRVASYYEEPPVVIQPSDLPEASVETLIRKTQEAIKAEDDTAIGSLFESAGASETQIEFAVSELKSLSKAKVHSIKVGPLRLKGELRTWSAWQYFKPNLPVVGFLEIEYEDKDAATRSADAQPLAGARKVLSLELGLVGDELRLVNYVPEGERTSPESLNPGPSITGHIEPLANGMHLVTDIITNPGSLLSAHLANEEIRLRDFRK